MRGLIAALQGLNYGEGSESWSSDVDGVRGGGPESEGGMDDVEEAQGRSEERVRGRHRTRRRWTIGMLGCGRMSVPSQLKPLYACKTKL